MRTRIVCGCVLSIVVLSVGPALAQVNVANALADLVALKAKVGDADTRTRVDATHRVWQIALSIADPKVKLSALDLLREPLGSSSDHIRMPAIYAVAEIANSTADAQVKVRALASLVEPLRASQVPIRDVAIDAVNSISRGATGGDVASAAVSALAEPVRSGNNGVRIPAINALVRAVEGRGDARASQAAIDLLEDPLKSEAAIGGMEVRMMAVAAMEKIGVDASDVGVKAKAMGLLQAYAGRSGWEPEAKRRAQDAAARVQATVK